MRIFFIITALCAIQLSTYAQNRPTSQWSYSIPFASPTFTFPLSFVEKNENHIIESQVGALGPNFWYHSKSRLGLELGMSVTSYTSYDTYYTNWVERNGGIMNFSYQPHNNDYNIQLNSLLTYFVGSVHVWNFHVVGGYIKRLRKWKIPEEQYGLGYVGIFHEPDNSYYSYDKVYRVWAHQISGFYNYRIGLNAVHNGKKRLTVLKCWYDLHPPARIEYRIEEISANGGFSVTESRRLDWFAALGIGVEVHGFIPKK